MTDNPSSSVPPLCRTCGCHPPSFKNFEKQVHCEVCVPSSSVPVSKGEIGITRQSAVILSAYTGYLLVESFGLVQEYAEKLLGRPIFTHEFALKELCAEVRDAIRSSGDFARATTQIDSVLASQEARHRQEMATEQEFKQRVMDALGNGADEELWKPGEHWTEAIRRLVRENQRHRQEMEEAKRARDMAWADKKRWQKLCFEAEQREREAGAREKVLREALVLIARFCCIRDQQHCKPEEGRHASYCAEGMARAALASIRSGPSPVSAPPTKPFRELGLIHVCGPGCAPSEEDQPASPVEPGSDPQEPETR